MDEGTTAPALRSGIWQPVPWIRSNIMHYAQRVNSAVAYGPHPEMAVEEAWQITDNA